MKEVKDLLTAFLCNQSFTTRRNNQADYQGKNHGRTRI